MLQEISRAIEVRLLLSEVCVVSGWVVKEVRDVGCAELNDFVDESLECVPTPNLCVHTKKKGFVGLLYSS